MDLRERLVDEGYDDMLIADGFDDAFIGVTRTVNVDVACYSMTKCLAILCERDGLSWEEATEHFAFNVSGAWVGPQTPLFIDDSMVPTGVEYEMQVHSIGININRKKD